MDLPGAEKAKQKFDELIAAVWAQQLAQLHAPPDSCASQARAGSQKTTRNEGGVKTLMATEVIVACTVKVGDQVCAKWNHHGTPASPQSSERASRKTTQEEESP